MDIRKMKKKDFKDIPEAKYGELIQFHSLVIIPTSEIHDSGYKCMEFVAVDRNNEPICKLSGCSDVIHLDGIGGYGEWRAGDGIPRLVVPYGWRIDCIPCGYLRLFGDRHSLKAHQDYLSDFEVYRGNMVEEPKTNNNFADPMTIDLSSTALLDIGPELLKLYKESEVQNDRK